MTTLGQSQILNSPDSHRRLLMTSDSASSKPHDAMSTDQSKPTLKALPAPLRMMTRTSSSAPSSSNASGSSSMKSRVMAFIFSGRLMTTRAMCPSRSSFSVW